MNPILLTDRSRLQEIYDLRVTAYEHSNKSELVNSKSFPNGWHDHLDTLHNTVHWIIENESSKIIGSARLAILNELRETGESFDQFDLPNEQPFAYWSRLVVHPEYRKNNLVQKLDIVRLNYLQENKIPFTVCCATKERHASILCLGFKHLGDLQYNWHGKSEQIIQAFCMISIY